jgi:hypothetical protein
MHSERSISSVLRLPLFVATLVVLGGRADAAPVTLNFEGFPDSTILTTQYACVTFSNAIMLAAGISLNEFEFAPRSAADIISDKPTFGGRG